MDYLLCISFGTWTTIDREERLRTKKDSSTSDTSVLCTHDRDLLIPIKAN